jgi:multidrug resistance efflux pump
MAALIALSACQSSSDQAAATGGVIVVNAPAAGQVRRVLVSEGAEVNAGTPVVEIVVLEKTAGAAPTPGETAETRAVRNTRASQADIEAARAEVVKQEAEVMRLTPLVASGEIPQAHLDGARTLFEQAQQRLQKAQDAEKQAQGELIAARQPGAQADAAQSSAPRERVVVAEASSGGTVAVISVKAGDRVTSGQVLATLRSSNP